MSKYIAAKEGSIVDASFVNVPRQCNSREENEVITQGNTPESFESTPSVKAQKECDARRTESQGHRKETDRFDHRLLNLTSNLFRYEQLVRLQKVHRM